MEQRDENRVEAVEERSAVSRNERLVSLLLLALLSAFGLFDHSLWSANDAREGAMIREMASEHVWVTPVLNGQPYLEKPPLLHWTAVIFCRLFGTVNEGLVRLPAALYGLGAVLIIWLWGRELGRERAGLAGAFLCATSALYFEYSRIVLTDAALTFMVTAALYAFWRAYAAASFTRLRYAGFLLLAALSFYAKGFLGPGLVWVSVGGFLLFQRRWKLLTVLGLVFIPVFLAILAPWVIALWKAGGPAEITVALWDNQVGRFFSFSDATLPADPYFVHKEPITYYLVNLPGRLLPWTLLVIPALVLWFRAGSPIQAPLAVFLRFALAAMALILHLSSAKAGCYTLPLFPILFLMTGVWLEIVARQWEPGLERWLVEVTFVALGLVAVLLPLGFIAAFIVGYPPVWAPGMGLTVISVGMAVLALLAAGGAGVWLGWKFCGPERSRTILLAPLVAAALIIPVAGAFLPAVDFQRTYKPLAELLAREMAQGRRIALACEKERDSGALMFYLNRRLEIIPVAHRKEWVNFLCGRAEPAGLLVSLEDGQAIKEFLAEQNFQVRMSEHPGHKCREFRLVLNEGRPAKSPPRVNLKRRN